MTRILSEDGEYASRIVALKKRFTADADKDVISAENMPEMLKKSIVLSSSSIESYAKCAFSYFCKYLLNLKSMSVISFGGADVGNYMHFVLEKFVSAVRDGAIDTALYDSEQIGDFIDSVCDEYKEKLFGKNVRGNARNEHLFRRLRRTAVLLTRNFIDEFNVSEFRPVCFELPISFENDAIHPSAVELPSGGNAYLSGRIDRVDTYRRNGELFVKVIDYKTGKNRFSEEEMKLGLNIQLPLYLFSLCETDDKTVRRLGGENGDKIVPAAAFYLSARTPEVKEDSVDDSVIDAADMLLSRNGILLNEEELIEAMDSTHSGRFIPVKYKKNGEVSYRKNGMAFSREGFEQLHRQLNSVVCKIADGIKSGDASVRPLRYKETDACEYCHMKPICRFDRFNDN